MCKDGEEGWVATGGLFRPSSGGEFVHSRWILNSPTRISKRLLCCNNLYCEILFPLSFVYIMRLSAILFETSWVTFSSLVWFLRLFALVYVKKIIGLQGNADNSSKIDYLWPKLCGYFSREVMFDTLSNRRKSVPSFSPLPYSWFPLGQGRNNNMAYSLNLQTPSLP